MLKIALSTIIALFTIQTYAAPTALEVVSQIQQDLITNSTHRIPGWKVGDTANYNMDMGFIQGTMTMTIASIGEEGIWLNQDMDLGFAGKQKVETLLDAQTGEVKKILINGKEEEVPVQDIEILEDKMDTVTVPAGTYECLYLKIRDKQNDSESEVWSSLQEVPISGMVKSIQPSPLGSVTVELTSFTKL